MGGATFPAGQSTTTGFGEVFVGYNSAVPGGWLFGVEALGKFGNANSATLIPAGSLTSAKYTTSFIPSVRLGYLVTPATLFYGRFGWAFTRAEIGFTDNGVTVDGRGRQRRRFEALMDERTASRGRD